MSSPQTNKDPLGSCWVVATALYFTLMNLYIEVAARKLGLYNGELVLWHMSFAAAALGIIAKAQGHIFSTPHQKTHLNRSVIGSAVMLCPFYAVMRLPLATGVALSYTSPIFLVVFSFLIFKERIAPYTQAVLVLSFAGIVLLLNPSFGSGREIAALAGLTGGVMSGWAYLQVRELSLLGEPGWHVVFYFPVTGMVLGASWAATTDWHIPTADILPYLCAVSLSALVAQLSMIRAYKVGSKLTIASLPHLAVAFSSLTSIVLLDDKITWQEIAGMIIIVASGALNGIKPIWTKQLFTRQGTTM